MNIIKNQWIGILALVIVVFLQFGSSGPAIGGTTNFDNLDVDTITVDGTKSFQNGSATSTMNVGKACITIIDEADVSGFLRYTSTGFATSSVSCN